MSKKILGLDLGTTSIGWAFVIEAENEASSIEKIGVRVNPLTTDEQINFEKGKSESASAARTQKRSARRNLQRYKQRRKNLIEILIKKEIITSDTVLAENDKNTTHSTYAFRAQAVESEISKEQFACVLLMINKKRGYKSSRKAKNEEDGQAIDGMSVAKKLYDENITPGQLCYEILNAGKTLLPDFYRSDLQAEFDKVWQFQKEFYPDFLTDNLRRALEGQGKENTRKRIFAIAQIYTAENKGKDKKLIAYEWRTKALYNQLSREEFSYVLTEINNNINNSSGYLGAISDRSKELYFKKQTVGQFLYKQLSDNPHTRMKNQVFYRQDYLDEFETIWETQAKFHKELTSSLKEEIRDIIIFYQRKLKSQKNLIAFCEFENQIVNVINEGKKIQKTIGFKVAPKSSPLFQEFKIWQNLNSFLAKNKETNKVLELAEEAKKLLFDELNLKGNLSKETVLQILGYKPKQWELNYSIIEGNRTNKALYEAYLKILLLEGYDIKNLLKIPPDSDEFKLENISTPAINIKKIIRDIFQSLNIDSSILDFNAEMDGKAYEKQSSYQLWHLLYSYEGDNSVSGNDKLYSLLGQKFGFSPQHAKILSNITLPDDYGSLSAKAMRKIIPFLKDLKYNLACAEAGYNHSSFVTKEENDNRTLKSKLELIPKNSLRNPVVEKILNQMVNVINTIISDPSLGKPDEIRIELARELKKNAKERAEMTSSINKAKADHQIIQKLLISEFGIKNPTRNDIIRYKLYEELKINGYKTLYSNTYIPREKLFSKEFDIEHIIPKALLFDDSFSNKTICVRQENLDKGNATAIEYIESAYSKEKLNDYVKRVEMMFEAKEGAISKSKYKKLLLRSNDIGEGFIERDLRNSQYIAKKARQMLLEICKTVVPTTGSITDRLREDWNLINIMQELNFEKYRSLGLIERIENKDGTFKERILDWTKRNDHRHHAMDALTIAFTKHNHIQYLNYLNARKNENHKMHGTVIAIERKETELLTDSEGRRKRKFKLPMPNFREEAKSHLMGVLVSCKAKNKVVTKNKNKFKTKVGVQVKMELTPRGQLHNETVYGRIKQNLITVEKIGPKFDRNTILKVTNPQYRNALLNRLEQNNNDPKKAFGGKNSLEKNPLYTNEKNTIQVPDKIKVISQEEVFTKREEVGPDLNVEKVIDSGIRKILLDRLVEFNNNSKEAFADLEKNPIWLNKEKGLAIKRVTISGVRNAESLHEKKDHLGNLILDEKGNKTPVDFVSPSNNHHVAIYRDAEGNLQDIVVSFYETVARVNQGLPVIDKSLNKDLGWQFLFSMKQNEYFVFPSDNFDPSEIDLLNQSNNKLISPNLYRVQKFSKLLYGNSAVRDYVFRNHLETTVDDNKNLKNVAYKNLKSLGLLEKIIKVRINHIGQIVKVGE